MRKIIICFSILCLAVGTIANAQTWSFDNAHSTIGFSVKHLVISKTTGQFHDYSGKVEFDGSNIENGSVEVTTRIASIDTENEDRDKHLKSPDFFDVDKFPVMSFKSKKISPVNDGRFTMTGDLTIKNVTKEVTFDCEFNGTIDDPWGNKRAGFTAETTINRQDFNVKFDNKLQDGSLVVGNDVKISMEIELIKDK
ncbi:MAG: YceI family protein [candidate division Zixibacteria bacterium]